MQSCPYILMLCDSAHHHLPHLISMSPSPFLSFFLFACVCIHRVHAFSSVSYSEHCSSILPERNTAARATLTTPPSLSTSYFTGGDILTRLEQGRNYYYVQKNIRLRVLSASDETTEPGVYKVKGFLYIRFPYYSDDDPADYAYIGRNRAKASIKFSMEGFWSKESRKLCMVGTAPWKGSDRDAVLKLKLGDENTSFDAGVASGSLESVHSENHPAYFDPFLIFSFPEVHNYNHPLVSKEIGAVFPSDADVGKDDSLSLEENRFCWVTRRGLRSLELEYAKECTVAQPPDGCSPVGFLPRFMSLTQIQCSYEEEKSRFVATFQNDSYYRNDAFDVDTALIGEMQWDHEKKRLIGVACALLNPSQHFGNAVGDCTIMLSLRFPSVLNIRNDTKIVGQIWRAKPLLRKISVAGHSDYGRLALPGLRYEYTELDKARKLCTAKKPANKRDEYPQGQSYDMRFDMSIKDHHGEPLGWGSATATPTWVGNDLYQGQGGQEFLSDEQESDAEHADNLESAGNHSYTKMSYKISIYPTYNANLSSRSLNWSMDPDGTYGIIAEGLYDANNGHLCMVGCRRVVLNSTHSSKDCDILVEFEFAPLNRKRGGLTNGSITSTRGNMDPLYFDDIILQSASQYVEVAERSIWRMDLEITMVLISNTLVCIFVGLQIFHVKRNSEVTPFVSLVMLVILSVGHMIPLVLNFEAVFLGSPGKQVLELGSGGRLEANEVAVRVITMVALLLQLRLLQLVWVAKQSDGSGKNWWSGEKMSGIVSLALFIFGGMLSLVVNWVRKTHVGRRYSVWGDLRSYAGLILDGFLVPQILFNIFKGGSPQKALSHLFYTGMSTVRLVPHAYNQYRTHNYPKFDLNTTYYYANPAADVYSTAWDIIIPCGVVLLAVIVFVQQRHGGRCFLPQRFRGLEMYEKVTTEET